MTAETEHDKLVRALWRFHAHVGALIDLLPRELPEAVQEQLLRVLSQYARLVVWREQIEDPEADG